MVTYIQILLLLSIPLYFLGEQKRSIEWFPCAALQSGEEAHKARKCCEWNVVIQPSHVSAKTSWNSALEISRSRVSTQVCCPIKSCRCCGLRPDSPASAAGHWSASLTVVHRLSPKSALKCWNLQIDKIWRQKGKYSCKVHSSVRFMLLKEKSGRLKSWANKF